MPEAALWVGGDVTDNQTVAHYILTAIARPAADTAAASGLVTVDATCEQGIGHPDGTCATGQADDTAVCAVTADSAVDCHVALAVQNAGVVTCFTYNTAGILVAGIDGTACNQILHDCAALNVPEQSCTLLIGIHVNRNGVEATVVGATEVGQTHIVDYAINVSRLLGAQVVVNLAYELCEYGELTD